MNGNARHVGKLAWGVLAWVLAAAMSGCVSIPYDGEKVYGMPDVTTRTLGTEGKLEFHPEVERRGDVVRLRMVADGMFVEETTTIRTYKVQKLKMAVGVTPGIADDLELSVIDRIVGLATLGVLNCCMLGIPTLSGLLVEPFLPARASGAVTEVGLPPRRMALVGFSKYKQGEAEVVEKPKITRRAVKKTKSVEQIALWFDAEPKFWESSAQAWDTLVLRGVEAGRHQGKLYIKSVPAGHEYEKELNKMEWVPIDVEIPE